MSVPVRRSYLRAADRRDHILDCALEAFAKAGFHDTSIADICARARIGRGTLYEHFQDKGAVLSALLDRIANRVIDVVRQWQPFELPVDATWTAEDNVAFIEARCHMIMQVVFADADTASLILRMARGTGSARVTLARIDEQVVGAIAADVRAGIDQGVSPTGRARRHRAVHRRRDREDRLWCSRRGAHHRCGQRRPGDRRAALVGAPPRRSGHRYRHPNRAREGELQPGDRLDSKGAAPRLSPWRGHRTSASRVQGAHAMSGFRV